MPGKDGEEDQEEILRRLFLCCDRLTEDTQEATVSQCFELETLAPVNIGWFFIPLFLGTFWE